MTPLTARMRARIPTSFCPKYTIVAVRTEPRAYCVILFQREFEISNFTQFHSAVAHLFWAATDGQKDKGKYSDTSANEDNSFRNHIR